MLIADYYIEGRLVKIKSVLFGLLGFFLVLLTNREKSNWEELLFIVGCLLFVISALNNILWKKVLSFPPVAIIGGMCYSIYLLHYPIISFIGGYLNNLLGGQQSLFFPSLMIVSFVIIIISAIFFLLIEKPCMNHRWPTNLVNFIKKRLIRT
jgi:peptidoglycan/LPS O-acetylase OafA/YrhL